MEKVTKTSSLWQRYYSLVENMGRRMLRLELVGWRPRGRAKSRFMDVMKEDIKLAGAWEEDAEVRIRWRKMIGHPWRKRLKVKKQTNKQMQLENCFYVFRRNSTHPKQCNTKRSVTVQESVSLSVWTYVYYDVMQTLNVAKSKWTVLFLFWVTWMFYLKARSGCAAQMQM